MLFVWWYSMLYCLSGGTACSVVCLVVQTLSVVCLVVQHALLSVWWYNIDLLFVWWYRHALLSVWWYSMTDYCLSGGTPLSVV